MSTITDRITRCIAEQAGTDPAKVTPDATLEGSLCMDSLDTLELVMALEEEFEILISDEQVDACKTVADVIALVTRLAPAEV